MSSNNIASLPLVLSEEEHLLKDSAKAILAKLGPVSQLRRLRDSRDATGYSQELWQEMISLGWPGVLVPESHGGVDLGHAGVSIICEALGQQLTASPFIPTAVMLATAVRHYGNAAQQAKLLPAIASGEITGTLAVDEGAKHAPESIALKAVPAAAGYVLTGSKLFVDDGHVADVFVVAAQGPGGTMLFLVERTAPGLSIERQSMVDSRNAAHLHFDQVTVSNDSLLAEDATALEKILDAGRLALAAELLGAARQVFVLTLEYLSQRKQFGVPLVSFQALQFRLAALFVEIETAKSTVLAAARMLDAGDTEASGYVSVAKAKTGAVAVLGALEGVQLHGGMGMTDELDVGLYLKRIRVAQERYGDAAFHTHRLAQSHGY